jgi:hypothetical protein
MARANRGPTVYVDDSDVQELFRALGKVNADLRKNTNAQLRLAAKECATDLAMLLKINFAGAPAPQTDLVELSVRVKSDRTPVVQVGGKKKVGRAYQSRKGGKVRASAGELLWGVEYGDKHGRFAPRNENGYWIKPTVRQFAETGAIAKYKTAVIRILTDAGVI